jgi:hypothetical protein
VYRTVKEPASLPTTCFAVGAICGAAMFWWVAADTLHDTSTTRAVEAISQGQDIKSLTMTTITKNPSAPTRYPYPLPFDDDHAFEQKLTSPKPDLAIELPTQPAIINPYAGSFVQFPLR